MEDAVTMIKETLIFACVGVCVVALSDGSDRFDLSVEFSSISQCGSNILLSCQDQFNHTESAMKMSAVYFAAHTAVCKIPQCCIETEIA